MEYEISGKYIVGLCLPKEDTKENIDYKTRVENAKEILYKSYGQEDGKSKPSDVLIFDLNYMDGKEEIEQFIEYGLIDSFVFTPQTLLDETSKEIAEKVLESDLQNGTNTTFINLYDGTDKVSQQAAIEAGEELFKSEYKKSIRHCDISQPSQILSSNLREDKDKTLKFKETEKKKEIEMSEILKMVSELINDKDPYTLKHIREVAAMSTKIAQQMGMKNEELDIINVAALMHDIGKIYVSNGVFFKKGKFTDEEKEKMHLHAAKAAFFLNKYKAKEDERNLYARAYDIVLQHHESPDGKGYPLGLKDNEIDPLAKVLSVADSCSAMFGRFYQNGKTKDELIQELKKCSGSQFSPKVAEAVIDILETNSEQLGITYGEDGKVNFNIDTIKNANINNGDLSKYYQDLEDAPFAKTESKNEVSRTNETAIKNSFTGNLKDLINNDLSKYGQNSLRGDKDRNNYSKVKGIE